MQSVDTDSPGSYRVQWKSGDQAYGARDREFTVGPKLHPNINNGNGKCGSGAWRTKDHDGLGNCIDDDGARPLNGTIMDGLDSDETYRFRVSWKPHAGWDGRGIAAQKDGWIFLGEAEAKPVDLESKSPEVVYDGTVWHAIGLPFQVPIIDRNGDALTWTLHNYPSDDPDTSKDEVEEFFGKDGRVRDYTLNRDEDHDVASYFSIASSGEVAAPTGNAAPPTELTKFRLCVKATDPNNQRAGVCFSVTTQ